jgi:ligand-binding sensor domain-containing protein/anti-sigma regulatory factor (Ser/Thr protein kinase)
MMPATVKTSGSCGARWSWQPPARTLAAAVCCLQLASTLDAAAPELVKLAVREGTDIRFAHLTSRDGLSPGQVRDILQDDRGFLWFNTSNFLNRYDGYRFRSYTRDPAHPNYPAGGFLNFVFKDRSATLWIGSTESLDRFDPVTETSTRFSIEGKGPGGLLKPVSHISQDRSGIFWLATEAGLYRLDPASGAFRRFSHDPGDTASLSSSLVRSTYEDREGTLWVCTAAALEAFDRRTEKVTERIRLNMPESLSVKVLEDHAGMLWIAYLSGNGLASYDRNTRRLTRYSFKDREPPATALTGAEGIHEDADGNLWLATRGSGLIKVDPGRRSAVRYRHSAADPDSISEDLLMSVSEDQEGNIWVGTATTGVNRFQRKPLPFKRYRHEPGNPQSLLRTSVTSVYADSQENIWVGSGLGVTRIDGKSGKYSSFRETSSAPNSYVISIVEDRSGHLWFGTYGGLYRYDPRTGRFATFRHDPADSRSLSNDIVFSLRVDHQGTLWAGTADGLNRLEDAVTGRFRSWKADPAGLLPQEVTAIVEDSNGPLWLISGTLQRFDPASGLFTAYHIDPVETGPPDRESSAALVRTGKRISPGGSFLTLDQTGGLWVATANGLVRFDRAREQFTTYDERDGLPASAVNGILEDRDGKLWVSTAGGLARFDPLTKSFTNFYEADGLAGSAFEGYPAACRSRRGQMFFGSKSGLTSFWPEQIVERASIPPVVLTQFSLRGLPVAPGQGSVLAKSITYSPSVTLSHDENMFSFEFAALSYVDPQRTQYRYRLEPLDHSWNRVDPNHRTAIFTTLPSGKYALRVQASNNRGVWNEQGLTLSLEILPPWWETSWFRITCAVVFLALLWAGYRLRVGQLHRRFEMTLEARVGERTRIARELHDTLLQSFHAVALRLETVSQLLRAHPTKAQETLDSTIRQVAEAITQGRDAVQGLRMSTVQSDDLALAINALGEELATDSPDQRPLFRVAVEGKARELHPILRDEIYKIAAEALRNAFQHAQARQIEVEIRYDARQFRLRVRDDGRGIDPAVLSGEGKEGHYGLRGMRERAVLVGGNLTVWSEVDAGSELELCIPASAAYAVGRPWPSGEPAAKA